MKRNLMKFILVCAVVFGGLYVLWSEEEAPEEVRPPSQAKFLAVGDMFFDRYIRKTGQESGYEYTFSCVKDDLAAYDLVFGNLEGPITGNPSVSMDTTPGVDNNYVFTSPLSSAAALYAHNVRLVNLGNNHMLNFSLAGLLETERYLDNAGVRHFGDPDKGESQRVARLEVHGIPFSFVNWSDWTSDKTDHTVAQVRTEAEAGRTVIVYAHWGEEYQPPLPRMKTLAHSFVDAGASIVIGSHPHIVEEHELYKGKWIYYSLGNFIFDQYWDNSVDHGLTLDLIFSKTGVSVSERPVVLNRDGRTCFEKPL